MATLGQLKTSVGRKFSLDTTAGTDDSNALIDWANEGALDVLLRSKCFVDYGDMTLTTGTTDYRLDVLILAVLDVHVTGQGSRSFQRLSFQELLEKRNNSTSPGEVRYYAIQGDLLLVHPNPVVTTNLRFYYVPRPTPMTNDSNDPSASPFGSIPKEYHKSIESYMMWQAAEFQGDFSGQLEQEYERRLSRATALLNKKGGKLPRAKLAPLQRTGPSDPSVVRIWD